MKNWAYKVVKKQRGMQGEWFSYRASLTTDSESEALEYARAFADDQRKAGVVGTRIVVTARKGNRLIESINV